MLNNFRLQRHPWLRIVLQITALSSCLISAAANASSLPRNGLVVHLEAGLGIFSGQSHVSYWFDQSGYGNNFVSSGYVGLRHNVLNGQPAVELIGLGDLRLVGESRLPGASNDRTMMVLLAVNNAEAELAWGKERCHHSFGLQQRSGQPAATTTGCVSPLHASQAGKVNAGAWQLHTLVVNAQTLFHLADGRLVDGRDFRRHTGSDSAWLRTVPNGHNAYARVAAVLVWNWALQPADLNQVHRYLGQRYFGSELRYPPVPDLQPNRLPDPDIRLWASSAGGAVHLDWQASYASACGPSTPWTNQGTTSGSQQLHNPVANATYSLYCWRDNASATASVTLDAGGAPTPKPVSISWQHPSNSSAIERYRLYWGPSPSFFPNVVEVDFVGPASHTLSLTPGVHYVAMSSLDHAGNEGSRSHSLRLQVN